MARADAASLITLADRIAREGPCAQALDIQALSARRIALVNAHRVPTALAESLSSGVNLLIEQTPPCLPDVPVAQPPPPPPPTTTVVVPSGEENQQGQHDNGKHHRKHHDEGGD
jgi:hypothetical protein